MWYRVENGQIVETYEKPQVLVSPDGVKTPPIIFQRPDELKAMGILPRRDVNLEYNSQFYTQSGPTFEVTDTEVIATYTLTPIPLSDAKSIAISQLKNRTNAQLNDTDWYYIRQVSRGVAVPSEVETSRVAIISENEAKETQVYSANSVDEILSIIGA